MDIRVGTIVEVSLPEGSNKLYRLVVDCGDLGHRTVFAGIKQFYDINTLTGRQIVVLTNLASKNFFGEESGGMLLAASENGTPIVLQPEKKVAPGTKVR